MSCARVADSNYPTCPASSTTDCSVIMSLDHDPYIYGAVAMDSIRLLKIRRDEQHDCLLGTLLDVKLKDAPPISL